MNIIFVLSDTFRRDHLTCYGQPPWGWDIHTPNLNRLADESIIMDRFYQGSFPTLPTIHDLMTGRYCFHTTGWAALPEKTPTVQQVLRDAGYVCMMISDCHPYFRPGMNYHAGFHGFDWVRGQQGDPYRTAPVEPPPPCNPEKTRQYDMLLRQHLRNTADRRGEHDWFAPQVFQRAIDWLVANHGEHEKFFLYLHVFDVHEAWDPPSYYVDRYDPGYGGEEIILPRYDRCDYLTDAELNHCRALYAGEISMVDRWFGIFRDQLRELRLDEDTAIIFTADHGFYIGDHGYIGKHTVLEPGKGWPLYDVIGHCPLLLRIPGQEHGRCAALCQHVDLMPTLCELGGAGAPDDVHGTSLIPVLRGKKESARGLAINSVTLPKRDNVRAYSTVTDGEYTLSYAGSQAPPELYHLPSDPGQEKDVIHEKSEVAKALHAQYVEELNAIGTEDEKLALRRTWPM